MIQASAAQPQHQQQVPGAIVRLGGWLFRRRTILPLPFAIALLTVPAAGGRGAGLFWTGVAVVVIGESIRLAAVRQIGVISRTRSERLGPLIADGPFAWVRNPLYIGNLLLWIGFTLSAQLVWLLAPIAALLLLEYHAIVRWEESLLESRLGEIYRDYSSRVPRWIPRVPRVSTNSDRSNVGDPSHFSWRQTLFSERGTLIAIGAGFLLLWLKRTLLSG